MPGALVGAALWVGRRGDPVVHAAHRRQAGRSSTAASPGVVATLVFLYVSATTLIFGAEVNAVLRARAKQPLPLPCARPGAP